MYMVKQVAALTGVPEATLRVWERRYGIVSPERSPGGYRLYDETQLQTLRQMAALVAGGVPASRAAQAVLAARGPREDGDEIAAGPADRRWPDEDEFLDAAASLDSSRLSSVIREALSSAPFDEVAQQWIQPRLTLIGDAWEVGRLSVAQEHFASAGLMRALAEVFEGARPAPDAATVLVGLPSGDHHQIALMSFATCLRVRGADVAFLGADVPLDDWVQAAEHSHPRAAVIGVTNVHHVPEAQRVIDRLLAVRPPLALWTGGSRRHKVERATPLPDGVAQAADELWLALTGGLA